MLRQFVFRTRLFSVITFITAFLFCSTFVLNPAFADESIAANGSNQPGSTNVNAFESSITVCSSNQPGNSSINMSGSNTAIQTASSDSALESSAVVSQSDNTASIAKAAANTQASQTQAQTQIQTQAQDSVSSNQAAQNQPILDAAAAPTVQGKWAKTAKGWQYTTANGPAKGFIKVDGKIYYLDTNTGIMKTGWQKIQNTWYFFASSGAMKTGWLKSGGKWYYLDPANGKMQTGKYKVDNAYYISTSTGAMYANSWAKLPEGWYYASGSGALKSGWLKSGGKWYWLQSDKQGLMLANDKKTIQNALYSFTSTGAMQANCQIRLDNNACGYAASSGAITTIGTFDGNKVTLKDSKGKVLTGWQKLAGKWFYGDENGTMKTGGWLKLGSQWYWLAGDGVMASNAWVDGGKSYVGSDGSWNQYANKAASSRIMAVVNKVPFQGSGYCARWVDRVYMAAGYSHFDGHARDFYWRYCKISDLSKLVPGMVLAVPSHTRSSMGHTYGHVAVYVGNGMVRHNVGRLETIPLSRWVAYYQTTYPVKCGWAF